MEPVKEQKTSLKSRSGIRQSAYDAALEGKKLADCPFTAKTIRYMQWRSYYLRFSIEILNSENHKFSHEHLMYLKRFGNATLDFSSDRYRKKKLPA